MRRWCWIVLMVAVTARGAGGAEVSEVPDGPDAGPSRGAFAATADLPRVYQTDFADVEFGHFPAGWTDRIQKPPSRNWAVDGKGFFRPMLKNYEGLVTWGAAGDELADATISAKFKKTEEPVTFFGLAARVRDPNNYYIARFSGDNLLELFKVKDGKPASLGNLVTLRRYRTPDVWTMSLAVKGNQLAAKINDEKSVELARVDGLDDEFKTGAIGINSSTFGAAKSIDIHSSSPAPKPAPLAAWENYRVLRPIENVEELNTPADKLADKYDVIVAGAGTGGTAAAIQAARLGAKVLLLEETDWIGGQMSAAAVSTMDEEGLWQQAPCRERGIYRAFNESMVTYYRTLDKDPFCAYYGVPQVEGGYEPKIARAGLYALIADARKAGTLDLSVRSRVEKVAKDGDTVTGATIRIENDSTNPTKEIATKIVIDATEYGDVIPLTGARYRVGNVTSDHLDPKAPLQDHTWTAQIREYPQGIPEHLQIKSPPPDYEKQRKKYLNYRLDGLHIWGGVAKGVKGHRDYRVYFAWRGVADGDSPLTGKSSEARHTQCGVNGGNDYPVTVATIEDPKQRAIDERGEIYLTIGTIYYFQHELGVNWSFAEDEGYNTPANRAKMKSLDLRPDLEKLAIYLPQMPYVRESRRIIGVKTLVANDLQRFDKAKLFPTSIAMGDYFMDLHRTAEAIETELDTPDYPKGGGPFQMPFEAFIPEKIDGFLPAEKNLSQSRLVSGATRLQPVTLLSGQAIGTVAALAVKQNVQPRKLDPKQVQLVQLESGSTLVQRWYNDVRWNTPIWRATQLLTLHGVMDRPGPVNEKSLPLGSKYAWGVNEPLTSEELVSATAALVKATGGESTAAAASVAVAKTQAAVSRQQIADRLATANPAWKEAALNATVADESKVTAGEFAILAAQLLTSGAK